MLASSEPQDAINFPLAYHFPELDRQLDEHGL